MVFFKNYFVNPAKRQIFRDASGQIFSLILRPCHTSLSNCRTIRIAIMDGCLFAMEIIGNYVNGPLFKQ